MISILGNWIYIIITVFCMGFGVRKVVHKVTGYGIKKTEAVLMAGLITATVYAQIFSLFGKVGALANLLLVIYSLAAGIVWHKEIGDFLKNGWKNSSKIRKFLIFVLMIAWSYASSRGYMMYDTDLYHAQSIRWMEEIGVVKGLGNLHERFAYNSAAFALNALYSMKFLLGRSLHTISGFFALLLSILCLDISDVIRRKKLVYADLARIGAIYYLTTIADEVVSPCSDYSIMCMIFYIVIKWVDNLSEKEQQITPYALLCVAGVYAVTLKLTAGLILILLIKPAMMLLKERKYKEIFFYLGMGLLVALPWIIRTVLISGYLIYPFPGLDLFSVDWKMKKESIVVDAAQIKVWGRALYNVAYVNDPVTKWFPIWFKTISTMEKLFILGDVISLAVVGIITVLTVWKKWWNKLDQLLVLYAIAASYLFWQLSAPLMRYGYVYVLLLLALTAGMILEWIHKDLVIRLGLALYGVYKLFMVCSLWWNDRGQDYYLWQMDYGVYENQAVSLGEETIYVPLAGDRTGYADFPSVPVLNDIELRGDRLQDGFRQKNP